jgi:serine phosphatase RsbU (regulator of sigma subunit)/CHASE3 domain sensor protein
LATDAPAVARRATPLIFALVVLVIVTVMLVTGGLYVRSVLRTAFHDADRVRNARAHVNDMLRQQLDEETGVRGYATLRNPVMLEAYYGGRANLPLYLRRVRDDLVALKVDEALPALRDAERTNYRWVHEIAFPLIVKQHPRATLVLRGKALVDRFRIDAATIYADLTRRTAVANARANRALVLFGTFAVAAVLVVIVAALLFTAQQYRLYARLDDQQVASEQERRRGAEARAAYEAEKRVADILQQAFAERLFPALPAVAFSATYVPATEQTKIGGDWYDAIQLSEDRVLVAIGDVTGHGIEAVVAMNKVRQLLISSALLDAKPGHVLQSVNQELVRGRSPIITAIAGVIDTRTGVFAYASAGHPPPVLFEPDIGARLLSFGSLPLGVSPNIDYATLRVQTGAGALIVLYTDGAIEYSRDLASGEAALLAAVESAARSGTSEAAAAIRSAIFKQHGVADDVAILAVKFTQPAARGSFGGAGEQANVYQPSREG